jgi:glutaredoxin
MRNLAISLVCIFLFSIPVQDKAQTFSPVQIYVFYIQECPACGGILQGYLPDLQTRYPFLDVKTFDVGNPSFYEALVRLEQNFGREGSEFPALFIGDQLLSGEAEIRERLEPFILEYLLRGAIPLPPIEAALGTKPSQRTFSVDLAYFYQKGCSKCDRTAYLLKYLSNKYPRLNTKEIDVNSPDGKRLNETLSIRLNLPVEKRLTVPSIFIGQDVLLPGEITEARVEALILKYEKTEGLFPLKVEEKDMEQAEESIIARFKSLGVLTVLSAGLIDGLNPCAFATMIFFISYLTLVGRKKSQIL